MSATYRPLAAAEGLSFRASRPAPLPRQVEPEVVELYPKGTAVVSEEEHQIALSAKAAEVEREVRAELMARINALEAEKGHLNAVVRAVEGAAREVVRSARREVTDLAVELAQRVVGEAVEETRGAIVACLDRALAPVDAAEIVAVRVSPARAAVVRRHLAADLRDRVVPDATLTDRVVVETGSARIVSCPTDAMDALGEAVRRWSESQP